MNNNSIQQIQIRVGQAVFRQQFDEAINLYSQIITSAQDISDDQQMSILFSERASCFFFAKKFEDCLVDSETAIALDRNNIFGHIRKAQSLLHLHKLNEAQEAIRVGRSTGHDHALFLELENMINNSWFNLGHKGLKFIATLVVAVAIGILTNLMGGFSGWKQGIIAMAFRGVARGGGALGARAPMLPD